MSLVLSRRNFLKALGVLALWPAGCVCKVTETRGVLVNDVHSQLNLTRVNEIETLDSLASIRRALARARRDGRAVCLAGGRHAMGGQQFAADALLLDTTRLNRVLHFDADAGTVEAEAGIQWPALIGWLVAEQQGRARQWAIAQKQTGADRLSLGGALAANAHGRGLRMKPIIGDVESFVLIGADGRALRCSRLENANLFRLVIGGYGLFGIVYSITVRLAPRQKVQRVVEIVDIEEVMSDFDRRIADGFLYGDFQFSIDDQSENFLRRGVFSCYRPVSPDMPIAGESKHLTEADWRELLYLAHADKAQAYERYTSYYLSTSGQVYWSDTHQLSVYPDNYHREIDRRLGAEYPASEMITEIYVPRPTLADFMNEVRNDFRANGVNVIYGTVRLIERDDESFLAWAKQPYACVIFNVHVEHSPHGLAHSAAAFRRLIDMAIHRGGSYYLTYHKFATRAEIEACYPQFPEFLRLKKQHDPEERFQSEWYRHYKRLFA
jgi:FAD/FMN-containing dehydrogenase